MNQSRLKFNFPKCQICNKNFDVYYHLPRVIPKCGHTFCEKCIKLKLSQRSGKIVFSCPECSTQAIIRTTVASELPRNIPIIEMLKNQKMTQQAPAQIPTSTTLCQIHSKKKDMVCLSCNQVKVCSHCALFGEHKGHQIMSEDVASSEDLREVKEGIEIINDQIQEMLLPNSTNNMEAKSKENLSLELRKIVKQCFKKYYEQIRQKQNEILNQCNNIELTGSLGDSIDQVLEDFDLIQMRHKELGKSSMRSEIDGILDEIKNLQNSIDVLEQSYSQSITKFISSSSIKINQTPFLKIQVADIRTLNSILTQAKTNNEDREQSIVPERKAMMMSSFHNKAKSKPPQPQSRNNSTKSKELNLAKEKKFNQTTRISNFKQSNEVNSPNLKANGKTEVSRVKHESNCDYFDDINLDLPLTKQVVASKTNSQSKLKPKTERSPVKDLKSPPKQDKVTDLHLQYVKPTKELNYELRSKFQNVVKEIDRQEAGGTLQLIGMDIKDDLIVYICEHLRARKLRFSMIKLVKNGLSDEGLRILLSFLVQDTFTKVLNVTSNHLTNKSLKLIELFINQNQILKSFYVSHNKITPMQLKRIQPSLELKFVQVIL